MTTLDYAKYKKLGTMIAQRSGLTVHEGAPDQTPCCDQHGKILMPPFPVMGTQERKDEWLATLVHEAWHHDHNADFSLIVKHDVNMQSEFGMLLNIIVDHNIEKAHKGDLVGADKLISSMYQRHFETHLADRLERMPPALAAVACVDVMSRNEWNLYHVIIPEPNEEVSELVDKISHLAGEYNAIREAGEPNYLLACKIAEVLGIDQNEKSEEETKSESGEGENASEEDSDGEGEGKEGKAESAEGKAGKIVSHLPDDHAGKEESRAKHNHREEYKGKVHANRDYYETFPVQYHDGSPDNVARDVAAVPLTSRLSQKVRNHLKVRMQSKWEGGKKQGAINKRKLAHLKTGNTRVFKSKTTASLVNTAVYVLSDASGSMNNGYPHTRMGIACAATAMLADVLTKVRIACKVATFSTTGRDINWLTVGKDWNRSHDIETIRNKLADQTYNMQNNSDGEFLLYAAHELLSRKEKRKVLIVLSDGDPCSHNIGDASSFTKKVIEDIEKSSIEVYAIGIQTSSVKSYYKNAVVVNKLDELEPALFQTLERSL